MLPSFFLLRALSLSVANSPAGKCTYDAQSKILHTVASDRRRVRFLRANRKLLVPEATNLPLSDALSLSMAAIQEEHADMIYMTYKIVSPSS